MTKQIKTQNANGTQKTQNSKFNKLQNTHTKNTKHKKIT